MSEEVLVSLLGVSQGGVEHEVETVAAEDVGEVEEEVAGDLGDGHCLGLGGRAVELDEEGGALDCVSDM